MQPLSVNDMLILDIFDEEEDAEEADENDDMENIRIDRGR